jgi:hypothetical protein
MGAAGAGVGVGVRGAVGSPGGWRVALCALILASGGCLADPALPEVRFANACSTAPLPWLASQRAGVPAQAAPEN